MSNDNNTVICSNDKSERISIKPNEFKVVKNFEPLNGICQMLFSWDEIHYDKQNGTKTKWFDDKGTNKTYSFLLDKDDKIISGAIIEYKGTKDKIGIYQRDISNFETVSSEFKGNDIQKEKIKEFLNKKVNGSHEEFKIVSNSVLSEAKQTIANIEIDAGSSFKTTLNGGEKGGNFIG